MRRARGIWPVAVVLAMVGCFWYLRDTSKHSPAEYPFGDRNCCLPCTMNALTSYARKNDGWFPRGESNAVDCLRKLIPEYLDAPKLAGISGSILRVQEYLNTGRPLDASVSSWVYWPGFRNDDRHELAILWELSAGVDGNGRRSPEGSHAVGFVGGYSNVILSNQWAAFLNEQQLLRSNVLSGRLSQQK